MKHTVSPPDLRARAGKPRWINRNPVRVGIAIALVVASLFYGAQRRGLFEPLEERVLDAMMRARKALPADRRIVLCEIDARTERALGPWPWHPRTIAELIDGLQLARASVIAFSEPMPAATLPRTTGTHSAVLVLGYPLHADLPRRELAPPQATPARGFLDLSPHATTLRYLPLIAPAAAPSSTIEAPPRTALPLAAAIAYSGKSGSLTLPALATDPRPATPLRHAALRLQHFNAADYCRVSAIDVIQGQDRPACWPSTDPIVLVGLSGNPDRRRYPTPFAPSVSRLELHAQAVDMLLNQHSPRPLRYPRSASAAAIFLLSLLAARTVLSSRRLAGGSLRALGILGIVALIGLAVGPRMVVHGLLVTPILAALTTLLATAWYRHFQLDAAKRRDRRALIHRLANATLEDVWSTPGCGLLQPARRELTVLLCRLPDLESLDPPARAGHAVARWNHLLDDLRRVAIEHGGTLGATTAEGLQFFFGAPMAQQDPSQRACRAALRMQDRFAQREDIGRSQDNPPTGEPPLPFYIALHHGRMVVGQIGTRAGQVISTIGRESAVASRTLELAGHHDCPILVTAAVQRRTRRSFLLRRIDHRAFAPSPSKMSLFELMAESPGDPALVLRARAFEEAVKRFRKHEYASAASACEALLTHHRGDGPARKLLARCQARRTRSTRG